MVLGFREELLRGIYSYGFEKPSAIQQRAIKPVLKVGEIGLLTKCLGVRMCRKLYIVELDSVQVFMIFHISGS